MKILLAIDGSEYSAEAVKAVAERPWPEGTQDGGERFSAGCYVARKSNLRPTDIPKEEVWRIHRASVSPVAADAAISQLLAQACRK